MDASKKFSGQSRALEPKFTLIRNLILLHQLRHDHTLYIAMLLRPLSFGCGALFSLCIVYFGRVYISAINYDTFSKGFSSPRTNTSSEASAVVTNGSLIEAPTVKYSVEDLVANSTLGVNQLCHKPYGIYA